MYFLIYALYVVIVVQYQGYQLMSERANVDISGSDKSLSNANETI